MLNINIADLFTILTTLIVFMWFLFSRRKLYLEEYLNGTYKIFNNLRGHKNTTALYTLEIYKSFETGWFSGKMDFTQPFEHPNARSGGEMVFIGYVEYTFIESIKSLFNALFKNFANTLPLEIKHNQKISGKIFFLMRNDIDISISDWKTFISYIYTIEHFPQAGRLKLKRLEVKFDSHSLLPDELNLVNLNLFPDNMFKF